MKMKKMFPDYKNLVPNQKNLILGIILTVVILFAFLFILNRKKLYEGVDILGVGSKEVPEKITTTPAPAPVITKPKDINQCNTVLDATNALVVSYQTVINDYEALQTAYDNYITAINNSNATTTTTTPAPSFNNGETTISNNTTTPVELLNDAQNVLQQAKSNLTSNLIALQEQKANLRTLQNTYSGSGAATK